MKTKFQTNKKKYNQLLIIPIITSLVLSLNASTIEPITNWTKYPLPQEVVSKSKGGLLADKEAMSDGIGSILIKSINGNTSTLNNEQYNKLLLLNKDKLTDTIGLKELIANGDIIVDSSTLNSINGNSLSNPTGLPANGTSCNDNNPLTTNDIYFNNVCLGTSIVGTSCDDNNTNTENDVYDSNGVCIGTPISLVYLDPSFKGSKVTLFNNNLSGSYSNYNGSIVRTNIGKTSGKWYWEVTIQQTGGGSCPNIGVIEENASVESTYFYNRPGAIRLGCYSVNGTYKVTLDLDSPTKKVCVYSTCSNLSNGVKYYPAIGDDNTMYTTPTIFTFKFKEPFTNTIPIGYSPLH